MEKIRIWRDPWTELVTKDYWHGQIKEGETEGASCIWEVAVNYLKTFGGVTGNWSVTGSMVICVRLETGHNLHSIYWYKSASGFC